MSDCNFFVINCPSDPLSVEGKPPSIRVLRKDSNS
jgi:hypothetical protein